jgi:hypothetical protein
MKSRHITSLNKYATNLNQQYVKAQDYNNLKEDFDTVSVALGFDQTLGNVAESNVVTKVVPIAAGELFTLNTSPKVLVAAPGAGYALHFVSAVLVYDSTATAFTGGGAISVKFSGGADQSTTLAATFLTGAGDKVWNLERLNAANGLTQPVNTALVLSAASGDFAAGTGVCRCHITYQVITTGL